MLSGATGGEEALLPIILDGENAWEHFEGGGRPFLRALYRRLSQHPEIRTVTMREGCAGATPPPVGHLSRVRGSTRTSTSGSATRTISAPGVSWLTPGRARTGVGGIGAQIVRAGASSRGGAHRRRQRLVLVVRRRPVVRPRLDFDELFRRHLRNVYQLLQEPVPDELSSPISPVVRTASERTAPTALISPTLDGEETSYFEWLGAGALEVRDVGGAMHQTSRRESIVTLVQFGFERRRDRLHVRLDSDRRVADLLADGYSVTLKFFMPPGMHFGHQRPWRSAGSEFLGSRRAAPPGRNRVRSGACVAVGSILELSLPLTALRPANLERVSFFAAVSGADGAELESHPAHHPDRVVGAGRPVRGAALDGVTRFPLTLETRVQAAWE